VKTPGQYDYICIYNIIELTESIFLRKYIVAYLKIINFDNLFSREVNEN